MRDEPNSAMCYFVCTVDSSRKQLCKFEGGDRGFTTIEQMRVLAKRCIDEVCKNRDTQLTAGCDY